MSLGDEMSERIRKQVQNTKKLRDLLDDIDNAEEELAEKRTLKRIAGIVLVFSVLGTAALIHHAYTTAAFDDDINGGQATGWSFLCLLLIIGSGIGYFTLRQQVLDCRRWLRKARNKHQTYVEDQVEGY